MKKDANRKKKKKIFQMRFALIALVLPMLGYAMPADRQGSPVKRQDKPDPSSLTTVKETTVVNADGSEGTVKMDTSPLKLQPVASGLDQQNATLNATPSDNSTSSTLNFTATGSPDPQQPLPSINGTDGLNSSVVSSDYPQSTMSSVSVANASSRSYEALTLSEFLNSTVSQSKTTASIPSPVVSSHVVPPLLPSPVASSSVVPPVITSPVVRPGVSSFGGSHSFPSSTHVSSSSVGHSSFYQTSSSASSKSTATPFYSTDDSLESSSTSSHSSRSGSVTALPFTARGNETVYYSTSTVYGLGRVSAATHTSTYVCHEFCDQTSTTSTYVAPVTTSSAAAAVTVSGSVSSASSTPSASAILASTDNKDAPKADKGEKNVFTGIAHGSPESIGFWVVIIIVFLFCLFNAIYLIRRCTLKRYNNTWSTIAEEAVDKGAAGAIAIGAAGSYREATDRPSWYDLVDDPDERQRVDSFLDKREQILAPVIYDDESVNGTIKSGQQSYSTFRNDSLSGTTDAQAGSLNSGSASTAPPRIGSIGLPRSTSVATNDLIGTYEYPRQATLSRSQMSPDDLAELFNSNIDKTA